MGGFPRRLLMGTALAFATLGLAVVLAQRESPSAPHLVAERETQPNKESDRLRQQNLITDQLLHHQRLHDMSNEAMWRNFYHQQNMIRSMGR